MTEDKIPTAVKIVNDALVKLGLEADFDVDIKTLLIMLIDGALRRGYVDGWKDCTVKEHPKVTEEDLIEISKLLDKLETKGG
jgi:hypothetical protein